MNKKIKAAAKMAAGGLQVASGVANALGHGAVAACTKNPQVRRMGQTFGRSCIIEGKQRFKEGLRDWKDADPE